MRQQEQREGALGGAEGGRDGGGGDPVGSQGEPRPPFGSDTVAERAAVAGGDRAAREAAALAADLRRQLGAAAAARDAV
jgi:hypothetical protein